MNVSFKVPNDVLLVKREELMRLLQEMLADMQVQIKQGEVMTIKETADFLKVSIPTVRAMIASKDIPFFQRGQVIRLNRWDVLEWMRENRKNEQDLPF